MKIYTKKGDRGETYLACGKRVRKGCLRICAYGDIDELNAVLGLCRAENDNRFLEGILHRLQGELFTVGADLATTHGRLPESPNAKKRIPRVGAAFVERIEKDIDSIEKKLPPLANFILPAGGDGACFLHLARTVCRRAERSVEALAAREKINTETIVYLNRLGDLLFVMARMANRTEKIKEEPWGTSVKGRR